MRRLLVFAAVLLVLVSACGPSGVPQDEYDRLASDLASAEGQVTDLGSKLASAQEEVADLESKLASAEQQLADCSSTLDQEHAQVAEAEHMWQEYAAALEAFDVEKLASFYDEDASSFAYQINTQSRQWIRQNYLDFRDRGDSYEVKSVFGGADWGVVEGKQIIPKEGRTERIPFVSVFEVQDGKILRQRFYTDR